MRQATRMCKAKCCGRLNKDEVRLQKLEDRGVAVAVRGKIVMSVHMSERVGQPPCS